MLFIITIRIELKLLYDGASDIFQFTFKELNRNKKSVSNHVHLSDFNLMNSLDELICTLKSVMFS